MSGYISNVPLTNQSLGQTQPTINNNFTVLNADFGADHVDFTNAAPPTGNGGLHNKVSLVKQTSPLTSVATTPIIFSKNVTYPGSVTRTEEFILPASGDGIASEIQITNFFSAPVINTGLKVDGSTFLAGGLILKWGQVNSFSSAPVDFATPFPNACFSVVTQSTNSNSATVANDYVYAFSFTNSNFTARVVKRTTLASSSTNFCYIAIGN